MGGPAIAARLALPNFQSGGGTLLQAGNDAAQLGEHRRGGLGPWQCDEKQQPRVGGGRRQAAEAVAVETNPPAPGKGGKG